MKVERLVALLAALLAVQKAEKMVVQRVVPLANLKVGEMVEQKDMKLVVW